MKILAFIVKKKVTTVDSLLSAVMVGKTGMDNQKQRINQSTHIEARCTASLLVPLLTEVSH